MHEYKKIEVIFGGVSLTVIASWWLFFITWQLGFIRLVQALALRLQPSSLPATTVAGATTRAYEYAALGLRQTSDLFFGGNEISHLGDVYAIYLPLRIFMGLLALFSFGWLIFLLYRHKRLGRRIFAVSRNIILGLGFLLGTALLSFPVFFRLFHEVLFPRGNWEFEPTSMLIQIFPEGFWRLMLGSFIVGAGLFAALYHMASRGLDDK